MEKITLDATSIDKVFYINLNSPGILDQLNLLGIPDSKIFHFEGIEIQLGYIGCIRSHYEVMKYAEQENWIIYSFLKMIWNLIMNLKTFHG